MHGKELITAEQAGELLNVTKRTVLKWAREKKIASVRVSPKVILFTDESMEEFIRSRTSGVECTPSPAVRVTEVRNGSKTQKKGGQGRSTGEMWNDLRKEVTWQ